MTWDWVGLEAWGKLKASRLGGSHPTEAQMMKRLTVWMAMLTLCLVAMQAYVPWGAYTWAG